MKARSQSSSTRTKLSRQSETGLTCTYASILAELRRLGTKKNVEGMAHFGIVAKNVYGVSKPKLDSLARRIGKDHKLALELWDSGVHDAKILAGMIDEPAKVSAAQMNRWVRDFDNWDTCDGTCCHLFVFAGAAWNRALEWTKHSGEFQKRAGFALIAYLAYRDKRATDAQFKSVLPVLLRESCDDRNFVRKAVNWALRNIGKRNPALNRASIATAKKMKKLDSRAARWIAADALRELKSDSVQARLRRKKK
jgi:3-methyladenine DNA glycosylase AlkD